MIRHVVMFKWHDDTADGPVSALAAGLATLPPQIPEIRRYEFGPDLGLGRGRFDFALVADFDDEAAFQAYSQHPVHLELIEELVKPIVDRAVRVQYRLS